MCVEGQCAHIPFSASEDVASPAAGTTGPGAKAQVLFGENYAKLQRLKKQYDPDLVFFKWNAVTPQA
jgi:FAD/FMN-containing dehydrogenase